MKESLWGYWLILLGIIIITVMMLLQNYTTTNQQDYYIAREVTYAAMYDAIDYGYYKKYGELKIVKEKFVENFIRRFSESAVLNKEYKINFYSLYEIPPAVSIEIKTNTGEYLVGDSNINAGITTRLTAILETKRNGKTFVTPNSNTSNNSSSNSGTIVVEPEENKTKGILTTQVYTSGYVDINESSITISHNIETPNLTQIAMNNLGLEGELDDYNFNLKGVKYLKNMSSNDDLISFEQRYTSTFGVSFPAAGCGYSRDGCRIEHYGTVDNVNVKNYGLTIEWTGDIVNKCATPLKALAKFSNNDCAYGIIYEARWEYEKK